MTGRMLADRTACVTGSGQNIDRAMALFFAKEGARVVVTGRSHQEKVNTIVHEIEALGGWAIGAMADASNLHDVKRLVETTEARFGHVDIAVSNVGQHPHPSSAEISIED